MPGRPFPPHRCLRPHEPRAQAVFNRWPSNSAWVLGVLLRHQFDLLGSLASDARLRRTEARHGLTRDIPHSRQAPPQRANGRDATLRPAQEAKSYPRAALPFFFPTGLNRHQRSPRDGPERHPRLPVSKIPFMSKNAASFQFFAHPRLRSDSCSEKSACEKVSQFPQVQRIRT